jgi:GNAT superfamily N-acetyltransferase
MGYVQPDRAVGAVTGIDLRPATHDDYPFALDLYVETIKPYTLAYMPWDEAEQAARFKRLWTPADTRIISRDGADVGWIEAAEREGDIFLKQMYVLPAEQRRGIGTQVLGMLFEEWAPTGKPVVLGVLKNNPARRLYERHGFAVMSETDSKFLMRREPQN